MDTLLSSRENISSYQTKGKRRRAMMRMGMPRTRRKRGRTRTAMQGRQQTTKTNAAKITGTYNP